MSKIAVVYWSGTGNTEAMARAVTDGAKAAGGEAELLRAAAFDASMLPGLDGVAFGCPAMGAEELEDTEFEPMFSACRDELKGKRVALFGSYGWGSGDWMKIWEEGCMESGIDLVCDSVICCESPDAAALAACRALGAALV